MSKSQIDSAALLALVVAAALALMLLPGPFAWLASIGGLILVFVLLAYDRNGYRSVFQSLAFSAVFAFCLMLASAIIFKFIAASNGEAQPADGRFANQWLPIVWACITAVFWPIDRARMSGRVEYGGDLATVPPVSGPIVTPRFTAPPPVTEATAIFTRPQRAPDYAAAPPPPPQPASQPVIYAPPQPAPQPAAYAAPPQPLQQPVPQPAAYAPPTSYEPAPSAYPPPAAAYAPAPAAYPPAAPAPQPAVPPPAPAPQPAVMRGKEAMIYVTLVGEGLNVLRSVRAEHLGRDFYRIVEEVPEGETWEYGPGQVVRCKKKNLSSGKALVAVEEAPRAQ
ncbi:MAG: hypothetical protein JOY54_01270 [Acidobacteriaceae bacterium]|nr:hypothetical protein [Acidobacteriaceae bacterium]